ncbi:MAG: TonB-dependent receptor plug domain-containing protein, partial [Myxococcales bacterium]|nr:TonB-dependent receptor plug domain-containing protein [Myxococcales bacterium]
MATLLLTSLAWAVEAHGQEADADPIEVDVRGQLLPAAPDATTATTHIDREDLAWPGQSTADVLATAPSVAVARTGGASDLATATLRGATSAETPVYFGPILLNDDLTGTADLSTIPPSLLGGIDVYRGHAPIEFERSGLGGAIVLRPFVASGTRAGIGAGAGSFGERSFNAFGSVGARGSAAMLSLSLSQTDGNFAYFDDRGTRFDPSDDREV